MMPEPPTSAIGLFLDVDGTLIDIAASPDTVVVPPALLADLEDAERRLGGALALVSGRTIANIDALFHPLRLKASGVHGAEFRFETGGPIVPAEAEALSDGLWRDLLAALAPFPGTLAENKGFSFAVHYRAVPDIGPGLRQCLVDFVSGRPHLGLGLMPGHFVFEVKRPQVNKGVAIDMLAARPPFAGRRPVFVGDDVTDWPGFAAVRERGGLAYSVGATLPDVSGTFADPAAVRYWLATLTRSEALTA